MISSALVPAGLWSCFGLNLLIANYKYENKKMKKLANENNKTEINWNSFNI